MNELQKARPTSSAHRLYALISIVIPSCCLFIISIQDRVLKSNHQALSSSLKILAGTSFIVALSALFYGLQKRKKRESINFEALIQWRPRSSHFIQTTAQGLVYLAWIMAWPVAQEHLLLLWAQVCFAYLCDASISWFKHGSYRLNLAPIPIVFSTNLFLFFKDEYFVWQWALIAVALLSRELFRWRREGRDVHIFNPSAIALSLCALVLINTDTMHYTWGEMIARSHGFSEYPYEVMFAAGLLVSSFFTVGFTIVSATIGSLLLGELYFEYFGIYRYLDTSIPIAVFLGMNLLVTDPVSSPWRRDSKILYGLLYGLSVFILYGILRDLERSPTPNDVGLSAAFCDKLLAVPLLNLCSPWLDRIMRMIFGDKEKGLSAWVNQQEASLSNAVKGPWFARFIFIGAWAGLFLAWVRPSVYEHPGKNVEFWVKACESGGAGEASTRHPYACENRNRMYLRACESEALPACHNLALIFEEQQPLLSIKYYAHACEGGLAQSCNHLGGMLFMKAEKTQDSVLLNEAEKYLRQACSKDVYEACTRQATLLRSQLLDRSQWTAQDWEGLWTLLNQACDGGEPYACFELSQYNLMHPQDANMRCRDGDELMCLVLQKRQQLSVQAIQANTQHIMAKPYPNFEPIFKEARAQLAVACSASLPLACVNLAWMLWRGDGGITDQARALKLMKQACDQGQKQACERLNWMQKNSR